MPRVLLLVPSATYRAADFLEAAKALSVDVVVAGDHEHAMSEAMATRWLQVSFDDPDGAAEAIVAHDALSPLDAVVAIDDAGTVVAAAACQRLGLRYNPPEAVAAARNKLALRALLHQAEVPQPPFAAIAPEADDEELSRLAGVVGLPCVVKPATLSGSQGVLRADSLDELYATVARVRRIATAAGVPVEEPLVMERFVPGAEVAVEGLLVDGALEVLAVFDKPEPLDGPAFEESIYVTPTRLDAADNAAVRAVTAAATSAMGLRHGPVHAEVRVRKGRAVVIEVAARTIGGLCSRTLAFATGRSLEEVVLSHALGIAARRAQQQSAAGVLMLPVAHQGRFLGVDGTAEALAIPGIVDIQITAITGRDITPVPEGNRYLGFVFARAARPEDVEHALRRARATLTITIEPHAGD